jgi:hypothetical protein
MADFFEQIGPKVGVTAENFKNLSGPEALQLYVSSLEKANVSQQDMIFFMEAIASDSSLLIPLLADSGREMKTLGDEAERTGNVLSQMDIETLRQIERQTRELSDAWEGFKVQIALGALPAVEELFKVLNDPAIRQSVESLVNGMIQGFSAAVRAISETVNMVRFLGEEMAVFRVGVSREDTARLEREADRIRGILDSNPIARAGKQLRFFGKDGVVEWYSQEELRAELAEIEAQLEANYNAPPMLSTNRQTPAFNMPAPVDFSSMENAIANPVEAGTQRAIDAVQDFDDELQRMMEDGRRVFEQTRTPAENLGMEIERLNDLLDAGAIDWDTYSRAIFAAQDAFDDTRESVIKLDEKTEEAMSEMSVFADQAARSMQDAFADFLFDPFSKGLDGMLQDFLRVLQRMAAEAAAAKIFEGIGGIFGGGGKSSGGGIGGIIGDSAGAVFNPLGAIGDFIGGLFADGGTTQPGKAYVVGERGPELFAPNQVGTVIPNHELGGSNVRIINVIDPSLVSDYFNSPGSDQTIINVLQRNAGSVRQILA